MQHECVCVSTETSTFDVLAALAQLCCVADSASAEWFETLVVEKIGLCLQSGGAALGGLGGFAWADASGTKEKGVSREGLRPCRL